MGEVSYKPLIQDMTWSYSRIKAFTDCPYRWYLKYIRYPGHHGKPMFFSDYGSFVHELIAAYYSGEKTTEQVHMEYLTKFNDRVLGKAPNSKVFANYFVSGSQYPDVFKYVDIVDGTVVSIGTHPSGVLISDLPIEQTVGLCSLSTSDYPLYSLPSEPCR